MSKHLDIKEDHSHDEQKRIEAVPAFVQNDELEKR